jgi:hypothetical protein
MSPVSEAATRNDRQAWMAARGAYQVVDKAKKRLAAADNPIQGSDVRARQLDLGASLTRAAADTFRRSCSVAGTSFVATRIADLAIDSGYHTTQHGDVSRSGGLYQSAAACTKQAASLSIDWKDALRAADGAYKGALAAAMRKNVAGAVSLFEASAEAFIRAASLAPDSSAATRVTEQAVKAADLAGRWHPVSAPIPDASVTTMRQAAEKSARMIADKPANPFEQIP